MALQALHLVLHELEAHQDIAAHGFHEFVIVLLPHGAEDVLVLLDEERDVFGGVAAGIEETFT